MYTLKQLWVDETGVIVSADLLLVSTIVVLGIIVGLVTFRDSVVQEFGDMAAAVAGLNQSYSFAGATVGGFTVAGSSFEDTLDDCDTGDPDNMPPVYQPEY